MFVQKAHNYFLGKEGYQKLNCCQAVLSAFNVQGRIPIKEIYDAKSHGGGKAPEGRCGALHAAHLILKERPEKIKECEAALSLEAGAITCKEIRHLRKLSCVGCVETVALCLQKTQE